MVGEYTAAIRDIVEAHQKHDQGLQWAAFSSFTGSGTTYSYYILMEKIGQMDVFDGVERAMTELGEGFEAIAKEAGVPVCQTQVGSMACLFFNDRPVENYQDALTSDTERYGKYFRGMLECGVYFAPSQFEACFTSTCHGDAEIDRTLEAAREVFKTL